LEDGRLFAMGAAETSPKAATKGRFAPQLFE
jgi:hypothetical protein